MHARDSKKNYSTKMQSSFIKTYILYDIIYTHRTTYCLHIYYTTL